MAMFTIYGVLIALLGLPYLLIRQRESINSSDLAHQYHGQLYPHQYGHTAYYDVGHGPVIVLLHGFGGWQATWHALQGNLVARGYRVIGIDALGAGASARPVERAAYTTAVQAQTIMALLAHLGIDSYTVIGHSYGGRIALQMAIYEPTRVSRVIGLAPEVMSTERPPIAKLVVLPVIGYALAFWSTAPSLVQYGLRGVSKRPAWVDAQHQHYARSAKVRGHLAGQISQSAAAKDGDLPVPQHFQDITCPVFLIWGAEDPVFPATHGITMVERMANAQIGIIPNVGHVPHEEAIDETEAFILQALGQ